MYLLRKATPDDKSLINTWNLSTAGFTVTNIDNYFVLESGLEGQPVGMLAIEFYDKIAYLHSLRLAKGLPSIDKLGILFDHLIAYCKKQGKMQLCLVVPPTSSWLMELGFTKLMEAPPPMKVSSHYQQVSNCGVLLSYPLTA